MRPSGPPQIVDNDVLLLVGARVQSGLERLRFLTEHVTEDVTRDRRDRRAALVAMILAGEAGSLAGELADMSLSQVRTRAKSAGVDAETLEGVLDEEDPKAALIAVILEWRDRRVRVRCRVVGHAGLRWDPARRRLGGQILQGAWAQGKPCDIFRETGPNDSLPWGPERFVCGCLRQFDEFGDRVCFCDLCWNVGCSEWRDAGPCRQRLAHQASTLRSHWTARRFPGPGTSITRLRCRLGPNSDGDGRCSVCGCLRQFDEFGDRVCFCDSCWNVGCSEWRDAGPIRLDPSLEYPLDSQLGPQLGPGWVEKRDVRDGSVAFHHETLGLMSEAPPDHLSPEAAAGVICASYSI